MAAGCLDASVCGAVCLPGICRGIQPLLLAHPCVCMGKDKDIQCIPETEEREKKKETERQKKGEKGNMRCETSRNTKKKKSIES